MSDEFTQRYQGFSDRKLLEIIHHPGDYLPEAVAAAQAEIKQRGLSDEEMGEAKEAMETHLANGMNWDWTQFRPLDAIRNWSEKKSEAVLIHWIMVVVVTLGLIFQYGYSNLRMLYDVAFHGVPFDLYAVLVMIPFVLSLVGLPLYAFKKKAGWFIMAILGAYWSVGVLVGFGIFAFAFLFEMLPNGYWDGIWLTSSLIKLAALGLQGTCLTVALHIKPIRDQFQLNSNWYILGNGLGVVLVLWTLYTFYLVLY